MPEAVVLDNKADNAGELQEDEVNESTQEYGDGTSGEEQKDVQKKTMEIHENQEKTMEMHEDQKTERCKESDELTIEIEVAEKESEVKQEGMHQEDGTSQIESNELIIESEEGQNGNEGMVRVVIEDQTRRKPFLGGYRNRVSGVEYHHSGTQTDRPHSQKQQEQAKITKNHRETQTVKFSDTSQQTTREQGTQMARPGLFIDDSNDRILIPDNMPYFDSEQLELLRIQKTIVIQAHARGWKARKMLKELKKERFNQKKIEQEQEHLKAEQQMERRRREIERQIRPRTKRDFEQLYNDLEAWRLNETNKIKAESTTEDEKKSRFKELLRRETKLLQTIDRLKIIAARENKHMRINHELEAMARPKIIRGEKDMIITVETPFTIRARELMDLYHGINTENLKVDERLDVLLHVKWTVKEFDCQLTRDIVELIDREADLLNRGRPSTSLSGLRLRISNLFLQFCQTPEFNPEAVNWIPVPLEYRPPLEA